MKLVDVLNNYPITQIGMMSKAEYHPFQMKTYICQLCSFKAKEESVFVHIFKTHIGGPASIQCSCGYIALKQASLRRHQAKFGCTENEERLSEPVPLDKFMRKCTQQEIQTLVPETTPTQASFTLDYQDWEMAEGGEDQQWVYAKEIEEKNKNLEKEVKELKRINDVLASELLSPELGVHVRSALSGFDAAWEEQQAIQRERVKKNPGADLFPDPPQRLQSSVTVPSSNVHLSRN